MEIGRIVFEPSKGNMASRNIGDAWYKLNECLEAKREGDEKLLSDTKKFLGIADPEPRKSWKCPFTEKNCIGKKCGAWDDDYDRCIIISACYEICNKRAEI